VWNALVIAALLAPESAAPAPQSAAPAPQSEAPAPESAPLVVQGRRDPTSPKGRATQTVTRAEMQEHQARSLPDALRAVPGVSVQQTSHGQASPFIRGLTGQRTLMLFDGFHLNHALFRQGPNQYLFTVDRNIVEQVQVVRGSASVLLGAAAIGGGLLLKPREPRLEPSALDSAAPWLEIHPRALVRHATQDSEIGGRAEVDVRFGERTALLTGVGYRDAGLLESSGPVRGPTGAEPQSPCYEVNGEVFCADREGVPPAGAGERRVQHGTGFSELTADARLVHAPDASTRLTAAAYVYRQFDAPRTDMCPPPEASVSECSNFEEQFRTHTYGKATLAPDLPLAATLTTGLGYQRYHERRRLDRPLSGTTLGGRDTVDMVEAFAQGSTAAWSPTPALRLRADYGLDALHEAVESAAWVIFSSSLSDTDTVLPQSRGTYIDGSTLVQGGAFVAPSLSIFDRVTLRSGLRVGFAKADAPADTESETAAVDSAWTMAVANGGFEVRVAEPLTLMASVEQGFRPPNLDDLTARQATGRGYQRENADLEPERSLTLEAGARAATELGGLPVSLEGFVFRTTLSDTMERRRADCPAPDLECRANRAALQLVNVPGVAEIRGYEARGRVGGAVGPALGAGVAFAEGETDNPLTGLAEQDATQRRVPLSRIAPLNGHVDASWRWSTLGFYTGATLYWARAQTALSYSDTTDARIPRGGTPGYARVDARLGVRLPDQLAMSLVAENLTDTPYRIHGSGINGPARGLQITVEVMR
jgi:iron complex outermembrane receptor protein/hemoglobin/transferrin/lactoferrin receptor protein